MARPTDHRVAGASFAPSVAQTPGLAPVASLNVRGAPSRAESLADGLAKALDIGNGIYQDREKKMAFKAEGEAAIGIVDEKAKKRSKAYADVILRTSAESKFLEVEQQLKGWYENEFDKNKTPQELNEEINTRYRELYEGIEGSPEAAAALAPRMAKLRAEMYGAHAQLYTDNQRVAHVANVGNLMRDQVMRTGTIDHTDIMSRLRSTLGNSAAAKQYVALVGAMAVERGDPDLMDRAIPDQWAPGVPGARAVPELAQAINESKYYAELAMNRRESEERQEHVATLKTQRAEAESKVTLHILGGRDGTQAIRELGSQGMLTAPVMRSLKKFNDSMLDEKPGHAPDYNYVIELEARVRSGQATLADVLDAGTMGYFGSGKEKKAEMSRVMGILQSQQEHVDRTKFDSDYRFYSARVSENFPQQKDIMGNPDITALGRRNKALDSFQELVKKNMPPRQAFEQVMEEHRVREEIPQGTPSKADTVRWSIRNKAALPQFVAEFAQTPEALDEMLELGDISKAERDDALELLEGVLGGTP